MFQSYLLSLLLVQATIAKLILKENAFKFTEVNFNKGRANTRMAEISVKIRMNDVFEDIEETDLGSVIFEIKSGDECWSKEEEKPLRRGNDLRIWRLNVVPCKKHEVRIGILKDGCINYIWTPSHVGPATAAEIAVTHYRPPAPQNIKISSVGKGSVRVSWVYSGCAELFELFYESENKDDSGNITTSVGFGSVTLFKLKYCTSYNLYATAKMGMEFSKVGTAEFTTCVTDEDELIDTSEDEVKSECKLLTKECEWDFHDREEIFEIKSNPEARIGRAKSSSTSCGITLILWFFISFVENWWKY